MVATLGRHIAVSLRAAVVAVQGVISAAFSSSSSPPPTRSRASCRRRWRGRDLNPLLQDSASRSIRRSSTSVCRLLDRLRLRGRGADRGADRRRLGALGAALDAAGSWMFLTLGIAMGSYWAYYELGWGGYWFWDPVENASFMPWLAGTALLHSAIGHGKARRAESVDGAARHPDLLAVAARHLPGAIGRSDLASMPSPPIPTARHSSSSAFSSLLHRRIAGCSIALRARRCSRQGGAVRRR